MLRRLSVVSVLIAVMCAQSVLAAQETNDRLVILWQRAMDQVEAGKPDDALASSAKAVEIAPASYFSHWLAGHVHASRGEHAEALRAYDKALAIWPREPGLLAATADSLRAEGRAEDAERYAERARQIAGDETIDRDGGRVLEASVGLAGPEYGSYDPRELLPLAVGNSWTYRRTMPDLPLLESQADPREMQMMSLAMWHHGDEGMIGTRFFHQADPPRDETYRVVRDNGGHWIIEVEGNPEIKLQEARDGRYEEAGEIALTPWGEPGGSETVGVTETIKRPWDSLPPGWEKTLLEGKPRPEEALSDDRHAFHVPYEHGKWGAGWQGIQIVGQPLGVRTVPWAYPIVVPAGEFQNVLMTVERYNHPLVSSGKTADRWRDLPAKDEESTPWLVRSFYARGVGKILEFGQRQDGSVTYEMELTDYTVAE